MYESDNYNYTNTLEAGLFDIGVVGTIPIGEHFEFFGRAGLGYWAADVNDWGYNSDDIGLVILNRKTVESSIR